MFTKKNRLYSLIQRIYHFISPEKIPFETLHTTQQLFPGIYDQSITLGKFEHKYGDSLNGNGLIFLCALAKMGYSPIVEFGTFRGRSTYNLAQNSKGEITTIDVGDSIGPSVDINANIEHRDYPQFITGELFLNAPDNIRNKINLIIADSTKLDLSHLYNTIEMVIVDGGHSYEVCKSDSLKALKLIKEGGVIIWDDYGAYWPGVRKALDELSSFIKLYYLPREGIVLHIAGKNHNSRF